MVVRLSMSKKNDLRDSVQGLPLQKDKLKSDHDPTKEQQEKKDSAATSSSGENIGTKVETQTLEKKISLDVTVANNKKFDEEFIPEASSVHVENAETEIDYEDVSIKNVSGKTEGLLHPNSKGDKPLANVYIDYLRPFITIEGEKKCVLAFICEFSKYILLKAVTDMTVSATIKHAKDFLSHYGKPYRFTSDCSSHFDSQEFEEFCKEFQVEHVKVAAGTPKAVGLVERANSMILNCLETGSDEDSWDVNLCKVQWALNSSVHKATGKTPNELMFAYKFRNDFNGPLTDEIIEINSESLEENVSIKMKEQIGKNRKPSKEYNPGDLVMIKNDNPAGTGESTKLATKYRGPYEIVKLIGNDRYLIQDIEGGEKQSNSFYKGIIAAERLKKISTSINWTSTSIMQDSQTAADFVTDSSEKEE